MEVEYSKFNEALHALSDYIERIRKAGMVCRAKELDEIRQLFLQSTESEDEQ